MARPRHAKPDAVQGEIVQDLRRLGFLVLDVSSLAPLGFDILVLGYSRKVYRPMWLAVEVKSSAGAVLTEREAEMLAIAQRDFGPYAPLIVARCAEEVVDWFGARRV